jgi:hypothetical protein
MKKEFPVTGSYNRFFGTSKEVNVPMAVFVKIIRLGKCIGISFIDSTPIGGLSYQKGKTT